VPVQGGGGTALRKIDRGGGVPLNFVSGGYPPWLVGAKTGLFVGSPQEPIVRRKKLRGIPLLMLREEG
jgi:hypothetical protein